MTDTVPTLTNMAHLTNNGDVLEALASPQARLAEPKVVDSPLGMNFAH